MEPAIFAMMSVAGCSMSGLSLAQLEVHAVGGRPSL
jgi:hypothetical protein